jgi:hypothetical protein
LYVGQGALPDPGNNYWNHAGRGWEGQLTVNNLKASDGTTATPIGIQFADVTYDYTPANKDYTGISNTMLADGRRPSDSANPSEGFTISGLIANKNYRLYLYGGNLQAGLGTKFTLNGVTGETTGVMSWDYIEGGNYVILDVTSNANGQIIGTFAALPGKTNVAFNGFQITDVVPHPSDLSGNGKVAIEDFGILSQGWHNGYEMADLLRIAEDWLLITEVAFQSDPIIEMDAVEGIAYSSTLSDNLVAFDASQLSFSKLNGPGWLTVAADGTLGGTPSGGDIGLNVFTIQVEDDFGNSDQASVDIAVNGQGWVAIYPQEYPYALRNPLMGFRPHTKTSNYQERYVTVTKDVIRWNELENDESDTIDKIKTVCNTRWAGVENYNIKVTPKIYLDWDSNPGNECWPADMTPLDYSSEQFKTRLRRLIQRLGQCWDNDPRVAWIEMGIIGYWGEQETPWPTDEIQQLMGDEFTAAFPNKKVQVRRPKDAFTAYSFGGYLDSWANWNKEATDGAAAEYLNTTKAWWKTHIWEGDCAYNCCGYQTQPGDNPDDTLTDPLHRNFLIDTIRKRHCTALGWVADYSQNDPVVSAGAEEVQRAFGYRYLLNEVRYPAVLTPGAEFSVHFKVTNVGSAPICYNWPVEVSLLNPTTKAVVWKNTFDGCDIRNWLSGDQYNSTTRTYTVPAVANTVSGTFQLPGTIANGQYILALAILDPAGMLPSVRFSTVNYFNGGRHPIGYAGVGVTPGQTQLSPGLFDDPAGDTSLYYVK